MEIGCLSWIASLVFSALSLLVLALIKSQIMTRVKNIVSGATLVWRMVIASLTR